MPKKRKISLLLGTLGFMLLIVVLWPALAANTVRLYLDPGSRRVDPGATFNVAVRLDTPSTNIAYVKADLNFPADKLAVTRIAVSSDFSQGSSPDYDNEDGQIDLSRIANPAKRGNLLVATITFRAKARGKAVVAFDSSVYARDGSFNNQLTGVSNGTYNIADPPPPAPAPQPAPQPSPSPAPSPSPTPQPSPSPAPSPSPTPFPDFGFDDDLDLGEDFGFDDDLFGQPPGGDRPTEGEPSEPTSLLSVNNFQATATGYTSVVLTWSTNLPATTRLEYGTDINATDRTSKVDEPQTEHRLVVDGLEPGKKYYYNLFAAAGAEQAQPQGDFRAFGLPVKVTILSEDQQPISGALVTIGEFSYETDEAGGAYFDLPVGEAVAVVESGSSKQEFPFSVSGQQLEDGANVDEQSFTFTLADAGFPLWLLLLGGVVFAAAGFIAAKRLKAYRAAQQQIEQYTIETDEPVDEDDPEPVPPLLPLAPQNEDSPLVNPTIVRPGDALASPPPPPVPVIPPAMPPAQAPPLPTLPGLPPASEVPLTPVPVAAPAEPGHHVPNWQAEVQANLAQAYPHTETDEPKDMFDLAEEQHQFSSPSPATAKKPTSVPTEAIVKPVPPSPPKPKPQSVTRNPGHHTPAWQAEVQKEIVKKIPHESVEEPQDMFDTAEEQYHYSEKLKKPPKK